MAAELWRLKLAGSLATILVLAACGNSVPPSRPHNVLFVLVDTLRADRLSAYGADRPTSPNFDRFAAGSAFFEHAYSQAACTFPSVNSILTSRAAERFLGRPYGAMSIPPTYGTLAEILRRHGYATGAVSASPVVRVTPSRFNKEGGFGAGFDSFDETCSTRPAECVNARALAWLDTAAAERPFFLYLQYFDPHADYQPPPGHRRRFARRYRGSNEFVRLGVTRPFARALAEGKPAEVDANDLEYLRRLYDDEVAYFDDNLGALLAEIERRNLASNTVVVFAADHGEEILEHDELGHCLDMVWDDVVHVPLAIRIPGRAPERVAQPVENLDIVPTVLASLGIDRKGLGLEGRDLFVATPDPVAMSAQGVRRAASDGRFKLVYDLQTGGFKLYDHAADAAELRDAGAEHPEDFRRLRKALFAWLERVEGATASERAIDAAKALEQQLRSVGYLQ